jgi:hypothetical protein
MKWRVGGRSGAQGQPSQPRCNACRPARPPARLPAFPQYTGTALTYQDLIPAADLVLGRDAYKASDLKRAIKTMGLGNDRVDLCVYFGALSGG